MSTQRLSATQREAIWLAHNKKCAYTQILLDVSNFHIDHILPEFLLESPQQLTETIMKLGLPADFDINGYGNLIPCSATRNLQKSDQIFDSPQIQFFLGIASGKVSAIERNVASIEQRITRGKAIILIQQLIEKGSLTPEEASNVLNTYSKDPRQIFKLLESMRFTNSEEVTSLLKSDIEGLRDKPVQMGENDSSEGLTLTNDQGESSQVCTCREYDEAVSKGYFPYTTFDIKMSAWFEHQCGLLKSLETATSSNVSYIDDPKLGVLDLYLIPYSFFPGVGEPTEVDHEATYQSKVDSGDLIIRKVKQNLLQIEEPEGMGQQIIEVARADFNGDGIEDILVFVYAYATHGTLGYGHVSILTRRSPESLFEISEAN